MQRCDAIEMLDNSGVEALGPTTWADLGSALRRVPSVHRRVRITTHREDFTKQPWPFADLDGILMANSRHYVENQAAFIRACEPHMKRRRFLIVEYDTSDVSRWLPYPVGQTKLTALFERAGIRGSGCCAPVRRSTDALRSMRPP